MNKPTVKDEFGGMVVKDHKIVKDKDWKKRDRKQQEKIVEVFYRLSSHKEKPTTKQPVDAVRKKIQVLQSSNVRKAVVGRSSEELTEHQKEISAVNKVKRTLMLTGSPDQKTAISKSIANSK